ncbi:family 2 encapsulin nanocompartment cargo protein terpene cyclase [Streptomyces sp. IMTB 2501]|uniref:family 2 encapsulin nanocompartment cargo protein terpene cyclase n=1 Tax=Streptomyces sp. IMTB 2501 TaxID=1776340 RepID=UPI002116AB33|nr:family 2 encapsulin nanocompartment cargo protein terpene cyclase [Streptomyces sp. IMTB 2501]
MSGFIRPGRITAPTARHDVARLVAALLAEHKGVRPEGPAKAPALPTGPTGLGTSAARITARRKDVEGTGVPELYCPPALRDDPALAEEVNALLLAWAEEIGLYAGRLDRVRAADFGRLMMLAHPDTDDPDRLLAAGKCALAEWATDDYYCDDETMGSSPALLGAQLGIAYAAIDPAHPPLRYVPDVERAMRDDPVRTGLRTGLAHLARYADWSQLARLRHEVAVLFVGYSQEGSWRSQGRMPAVWEYLAHRQINSFVPCVAMTDVVGGYVLPAAEYADPRVRRAVTMASTAATLVNDLYSMAKEHHSDSVEFNLPTVIAAEERCTPREAVERSAAIHDELVRTFETEAAALVLTGSPQLRRFLAGVWAWLGGNRAWHSGSRRYTSSASTTS